MRRKTELSLREEQVCRLLSEGKDQKEIASALGIRAATIPTYIKRAKSWFGIEGGSSSELVTRYLAATRHRPSRYKQVFPPDVDFATAYATLASLLETADGDRLYSAHRDGESLYRRMRAANHPHIELNALRKLLWKLTQGFDEPILIRRTWDAWQTVTGSNEEYPGDRAVAEKYREWRELSLTRKNVPRQIRLCEQYDSTGWTIESVQNRPLLFHSELNQILRSRTDLDMPLVKCPEKFCLRRDLWDVAGTQLLAALSKKQHDVFNARKLRLLSEISPKNLKSTAAVGVQATDYFTKIATDEASFNQYGPLSAPLYDGLALFMRDGALCTLSECESACAACGHVLAISSDHKVILQRQTELNAQAGGQIVPSGSGTFDWEDFLSLEDGTLRKLVDEATYRELREELLIDNSHVQSSILVGYTRDVQHAGAPGFYSVCVLNIPFEQVKDRFELLPRRREGFHDELMGRQMDVRNGADLSEQFRKLAPDADNPFLVMCLNFAAEASADIRAAL